MSNATYVPDSFDAPPAAPWQILRKVRAGRLLGDSIMRLRTADGLSYARSFGFQTVMAALPGLIFLAATAVRTGLEPLAAAVESTLTALTPGPTADLFRTAMDQAEDTAGGDLIAMLLGGAAALTSGAVAMAQVSRGANRIYGEQSDRPTARRYGLAVLVAVAVGCLFVAAFFGIAAGETVGRLVGDGSTWLWLRWPAGALSAVVAVSILYKLMPRRRQPPIRWMVLPAGMATVLWLAASSGLSMYLNLSSAFGEVYGPLAGFIGLMMWAQLTGIALFWGLALAAELEARSLEPDSGPLSLR